MNSPRSNSYIGYTYVETLQGESLDGFENRGEQGSIKNYESRYKFVENILQVYFFGKFIELITY